MRSSGGQSVHSADTRSHVPPLPPRLRIRPARPSPSSRPPRPGAVAGLPLERRTKGDNRAAGRRTSRSSASDPAEYARALVETAEARVEAAEARLDSALRTSALPGGVISSLVVDLSEARKTLTAAVGALRSVATPAPAPAPLAAAGGDPDVLTRVTALLTAALGSQARLDVSAPAAPLDDAGGVGWL